MQAEIALSLSMSIRSVALIPPLLSILFDCLLFILIVFLFLFYHCQSNHSLQVKWHLRTLSMTKRL
jgi:hypothetical protein